MVEYCLDYDSVVKTLDKLYIKTPNVIFAHHRLATRHQQRGELLAKYLQELKRFSNDCKLKAVTAAEYQDELVQDSFINGLSSPNIRQRLLEEHTLTLSPAFDKASVLDLAQQNAEAYTSSDIPGAVAAVPAQSSERVLTQPSEADSPPESTSAAAQGHSKRPKSCCFCGGAYNHSRSTCPARNAFCGTCSVNGHYTKVCMSKHRKTKTNAAMISDDSGTMAALHPSPSSPPFQSCFCCFPPKSSTCYHSCASQWTFIICSD